MVFGTKPFLHICRQMLMKITTPYTNPSVFQGGSHRVSVSEDKDPFRFRHMISTDSLQVRALASMSIVPDLLAVYRTHTENSIHAM